MNAADFEPDPVLVELVEAARRAVAQASYRSQYGKTACGWCMRQMGTSDDDKCPTCRLARALAAYDAEAECPRD